MTTPAVTPPTVPAGDPPKGGADDANEKFISADDFEGHKKFLNKELVGLRKGNESLAALVAGLQEKLEATPPAAATGKKDEPKDLQSAEMARKVKALEERLEASERAEANALIESAITDAIAGTSKKAQDVLRGFLKAQAKIEKVDGKPPVVVVPGEDGPVQLTSKYVRERSDGDFWFPASGKSGSGMSETGGKGGDPGVSVEQGLKDQAYFDKNRKAILEEMARQRKAGA